MPIDANTDTGGEVDHVAITYIKNSDAESTADDDCCVSRTRDWILLFWLAEKEEINGTVSSIKKIPD